MINGDQADAWDVTFGVPVMMLSFTWVWHGSATLGYTERIMAVMFLEKSFGSTNNNHSRVGQPFAAPQTRRSCTICFLFLLSQLRIIMVFAHRQKWTDGRMIFLADLSSHSWLLMIREVETPRRIWYGSLIFLFSSCNGSIDVGSCKQSRQISSLIEVEERKEYAWYELMAKRKCSCPSSWGWTEAHLATTRWVMENLGRFFDESCDEN